MCVRIHMCVEMTLTTNTSKQASASAVTNVYIVLISELRLTFRRHLISRVRSNVTDR